MAGGSGGFEHVGVMWAPHALEEKYDLDTLGTPLRDPSCEPTKSTGVSLDHCIEGFLQEEPLGLEDMWYCPKCKEHRQATKKLEMWRVPQSAPLQRYGSFNDNPQRGSNWNIHIVM
eukprot:4813321-Pyramimonas_sp.AAC.1